MADERAMADLEDRPSELILAAGGLVVRRTGSASLEMAIVHRPIREDWSFPKGKVEPDEMLTACALREVEEETGLRCRILSFVGTTEYRDRKDRPKVVAYWAMTPERGDFRASEEVDEMRWVKLGPAALEILTYERDHELVSSLQEAARLLIPKLRRGS